MSLNDSVITGKCPGCATYKAELKEARAKLEAVEALRQNYQTSLGIREAPTGERGVAIRYFVNSLDRILKGGD